MQLTATIEQRDAGHVDARRPRLAVVAHVAPQQNERDDAGNEIDVEYPGPREVVDEDSAERRTDRWTEDGPERENRLAQSELFAGKRFAQHDLRRRQQSAAERALHDAKENQRGSDVAMPHSSDASVKPAIDARK